MIVVVDVGWVKTMGVGVCGEGGVSGEVGKRNMSSAVIICIMNFLFFKLKKKSSMFIIISLNAFDVALMFFLHVYFFLINEP